MFLHYYLEYSIKYNLLVGYSLNPDLKKYIWEIYKKIIARDILEKFLINRMFQCSDCNTRKWKMNFITRRHNFYYVPACNSEPYPETPHCCEKIICFSNCKFNVYCSNCQEYNKFTIISNSGIGWNPTENLKNIVIQCNKCDQNKNYSLTWNYTQYCNK
jgi:hypothetical protein